MVNPVEYWTVHMHDRWPSMRIGDACTHAWGDHILDWIDILSSFSRSISTDEKSCWDRSGGFYGTYVRTYVFNCDVNFIFFKKLKCFLNFFNFIFTIEYYPIYYICQLPIYAIIYILLLAGSSLISEKKEELKWELVKTIV